MVIVEEGLLLKAGLQYLAGFTVTDSVGDVGINPWPEDCLSCPALRCFHTPVAVVKSREGASAKGSRNNDPRSVEDEVAVRGKAVPQFPKWQQVVVEIVAVGREP